MRWQWLTMLMVGGWLGLGCGKTVFRSHEAQFCSTNDDDDPFYECSPSTDLVCISTYSQIFGTGVDGGTPTTLPLYLCRLACTPGGPACPNNELCCPGPIVGRNYGKMHACVPESRCDNPDIPDGGFDMRPDRPGPEMGREAGGEAGSEAGGGDVPVDAPAGDTGGPDAGGGVDAVDAPAGEPDVGAGAGAGAGG